MDKRLRKQAAFYTLTSIVDANNGSVDFNTNTIKRAFNNEDEIVMVEYTNGNTGLAYDADISVLEDAIHEWINKGNDLLFPSND